MRERPTRRRWINSSVGITPARAGKTGPLRFVTLASRDHPRSCGKDFLMDLPNFLILGSPPLVRERLNVTIFRDADLRITPARAGKTILIRPAATDSRDHPRSCGKDFCRYFPESVGPGSPPLVRERLATGIAKDSTTRITPARAGKTDLEADAGHGTEDHPRSCGKDHPWQCLYH